MINIQGVALVRNGAPRKARKPSKPYKQRTKPNSNKGTGANAEPARILWMRAEGRTLQEIGEEFHVSRERIRQILKANGIAGVIPKPEKPPRILRFMVVMYRWLEWAGFRYCNACKIVKDLCEFSTKCRQCRECNTARQRKNYHKNPKIRAYQLTYSRSERARQYQREYHSRPDVIARKAPKSKEASRKHYQAIRNDPERWQAYQQKKREYDRKRQAAKKTSA